MPKLLKIVLLFVFLFGCASSANRDQLKMRELVHEKNFTEAKDVLEKSPLKNANDQLLYVMELGSLAFYEGHYLEAAKNWQRALETISQQYVKISQVATSGVVSDQLKDFHAKEFEISYLYYFQALAFYFEYLKSNDRNVLLQARASVIAWDGFLKSLQIDNEFKNLYFDDYYARFFAGLIHEAVGGRSDQEVALQLYKDAYQLFLLQAPTYPQFNSDSVEYAKVLLKKLQSKEKWREELQALAQKNQTISNTDFQKIRNLIGSKLLELTKKVRKNDYKKLSTSMKLSEEQSGNVVLLWHDGWVNPVEAKKIRLSLEAAAKNGSGTQAVMTVIAQAGFLIFASKVLGHSSGHSHTSTNVSVGWYGTGDITNVVAGAASLEFEIPDVKVPASQVPGVVELQTTEGRNIGNVSLVMVQSLNDLVFQTIERQKALDIFKKGTRFAVKQVGAMIGSYALYKSMVAANPESEGLAKLSAMAAYFGAAKLVSVSENADTRFWSVLPGNIQMGLVKTTKNDTGLNIKKPDGSTQEVKISSDPNLMQIIPLF